MSGENNDYEDQDAAQEDDTLRFCLHLNTVPVEIEDQNGQKKRYLLRELTGPERDDYIDSMMGRMKFSKDGRPQGVSSMKGAQVALIKLALRNEDGQPVHPSVMQSWPARVQQAIFNKIRKMSYLDDDAEERAKNS